MDAEERSLYDDDDDHDEETRQAAEDFDNREVEGEENYGDDYW